MAAEDRTGHVLDSIALVEAVLRGDMEAVSAVLNHCDLRPVAVTLADLLAQCLQGEFGEAAVDAIAALRPQVLGGGEQP
jgi:hypothetical protein